MTLCKTFFFSFSETVSNLWNAIYSITEEKDADELRVI
jgi:hypothetical protein